MGIDIYALNFLLKFRGVPNSWGNLLTLGRQVKAFPAQHYAIANDLLSTYGASLSDFDENPFCEQIFKFLGTKSIRALDISSYQGADIIHDLNRPIPEHLESQFDAVYDGGTLEHIFDVPMALQNISRLLKTGGRYFAAIPANNNLGHGFYQFSPELMWRVFSRQNGFKVELMALTHHSGSRPELINVWDPELTGRREEIGFTPFSTALMVAARKVADVSSINAYQSDYVLRWKGFREGPLMDTDRTILPPMGLAVCSCYPDQLEALVVGGDHALWHRSFNGDSWTSDSWTSLHGICISAPAAVSPTPARMNVFVIGIDHSLYHQWWDGQAWSGWAENLNGSCWDGVAACSCRPGRIDVFSIGLDRAIWHRAFDDSSWGDWGSLGGTWASAPTVTSFTTNRIDVFAIGVDRSLYHQWWDGRAWSGWENTGGFYLDVTAGYPTGCDRLDIFAVGGDRVIQHRTFDGSIWRDRSAPEGTCISAPAAALSAPDHIDLFAVGLNWTLHHNRWDGYAWCGWKEKDYVPSLDR